MPSLLSYALAGAARGAGTGIASHAEHVRQMRGETLRQAYLTNRAREAEDAAERRLRIERNDAEIRHLENLNSRWKISVAEREADDERSATSNKVRESEGRANRAHSMKLAEMNQEGQNSRQKRDLEFRANQLEDTQAYREIQIAHLKLKNAALQDPMRKGAPGYAAFRNQVTKLATDAVQAWATTVDEETWAEVQDLGVIKYWQSFAANSIDLHGAEDWRLPTQHPYSRSELEAEAQEKNALIADRGGDPVTWEELAEYYSKMGHPIDREN